MNIEESVRGDDVYIIQSTSFPVNNHLMELLIMVDACVRASAHSINVVLPYFGYARQDRIASPREPLTAKLVANMLVRLVSIVSLRLIYMPFRFKDSLIFLSITSSQFPYLQKHYCDKGSTWVRCCCR